MPNAYVCLQEGGGGSKIPHIFSSASHRCCGRSAGISPRRPSMESYGSAAIMLLLCTMYYSNIWIFIILVHYTCTVYLYIILVLVHYACTMYNSNMIIFNQSSEGKRSWRIVFTDTTLFKLSLKKDANGNLTTSRSSQIKSSIIPYWSLFLKDCPVKSLAIGK